jgi:hypothetical protein
MSNLYTWATTLTPQGQTLFTSVLYAGFLVMALGLLCLEVDTILARQPRR